MITSDSENIYIRSLTPRQRIWLIAALTFATLIKLYLAATTHGSTDVDAFTDQLLKVRELGVGAYHVRGIFENPFNHPPPMIHVLKALGFITDVSRLPFGFWLRLLPILASIGSFFLVWRLLRDRKDLFPLLLALALCPISIMVDGYHGNTDSVVIMFLLLSVYLIQDQKSYLWAGLAFGLACCVKVVPLMLVPAFLLYLPDMKTRIKFAAMATGIFVAMSLPYIAQDPMAVKRAVFDYASVYGVWGVPLLLKLFWPEHAVYAHEGGYDPIGIHGVFAAILKYLAIVTILTASVWLNIRKHKPPLFVQCGIIISILLFLAPGFGLQYLVWLVPFVLILGVRVTLIYYIAGSLYLVLAYADYPKAKTNAVLFLGLAFAICAWFTLRIVLGHYYKLVRD